MTGVGRGEGGVTLPNMINTGKRSCLNVFLHSHSPLMEYGHHHRRRHHQHDRRYHRHHHHHRHHHKDDDDDNGGVADDDDGDNDIGDSNDGIEKLNSRCLRSTLPRRDPKRT